MNVTNTYALPSRGNLEENAMGEAVEELTTELTELEGDLRERSSRLRNFPDGQRATRQANAVRITIVLLRVFQHDWASTVPLPRVQGQDPVKT